MITKPGGHISKKDFDDTVSTAQRVGFRLSVTRQYDEENWDIFHFNSWSSLRALQKSSFKLLLHIEYKPLITEGSSGFCHVSQAFNFLSGYA